MSRQCALTKKGVLSGRRVSHSHVRTLRKFLPNLTAISFYSEALGKSIRLRVATNTIRTIEKNGGLDSWLLKAHAQSLSTEAQKLKRQILKKTSPEKKRASV